MKLAGRYYVAALNVSRARNAGDGELRGRTDRRAGISDNRGHDVLSANK